MLCILSGSGLRECPYHTLMCRSGDYCNIAVNGHKKTTVDVCVNAWPFVTIRDRKDCSLFRGACQVEMKKKTSAKEASNPTFAAQAEKSIRDSAFVRLRGRCQQFVRQNIQKKYGARFDSYHKASAHLSMKAWEGSPYAVEPVRGSVVGDILYKSGTKSNPAGHVGIRVPGNRVAENSSTSIGRVSGAKGFRSLEEFGKVDLIVRLPRS